MSAAVATVVLVAGAGFAAGLLAGCWRWHGGRHRSRARFTLRNF